MVVLIYTVDDFIREYDRFVDELVEEKRPENLRIRLDVMYRELFEGSGVFELFVTRNTSEHFGEKIKFKKLNPSCLQETFNYIFLNYDNVTPIMLNELDRTTDKSILKDVDSLRELIEVYYTLNYEKYRINQITIMWHGCYAAFTVELYKRSMNAPLELILHNDGDMEQKELALVISKIERKIGKKVIVE